MRTHALSLLALLLSLAPVRAAAPDFETEVVPVLTKAGCNAGACHGAAIGRGGLKLSLQGYDPKADHEALVEEQKARRVNLAHPAKSLVLRKPSRQLPHEGGRRLPVDGDGYRIVLDWIKAGAPRGASKPLARIEVSPVDKLLSQTGEKFQVQVHAVYRDGSKVDVTRWAVYSPADSAALSCTSDGEVTIERRGQHVLMVRFLGEVGCVIATVPVNDPDQPIANRPGANFIDEHVNRNLDRLGLPHSDRCDDGTFFRRVFVHLLGVLPEPKEIDAFLADRDADKRGKLIDQLMKRPEFVDRWAYFWGDLLRIESRRLNPEGAAAFHAWIREKIEKNTPYDKMARELILATGDGFTHGPANFSRVPTDARSYAEHVSQVFLGVRLQCANCHNHPLDRWTQDDYHGLAAVFARVGRGRNVQVQPRGEVTHPKSGSPAQPRIPGVEFIKGERDPREQFADWLTAKDNPLFAKAIVNRIWKELMGRGVVEPVDDLRATNPATHPELLDALARDLADSGYDLRHVMRTILMSEAYQRSFRSVNGNRGDERYYSRAVATPLAPHVYVDAVARVTGVPEKLGGHPLGTRAGQLGDSRVPSMPLDLLNRCRRDTPCDAAIGAAAAASLPLMLHAINGPWLNAKISDPKGRLHQLIDKRKTDAEIVTSFYEFAFTRKPSEAELAFWTRKFAGLEGKKRTDAFEDFLWAMLNSAEFTTNH